jgi:hypothetical protein
MMVGFEIHSNPSWSDESSCFYVLFLARLKITRQNNSHKNVLPTNHSKFVPYISPKFDSIILKFRVNFHELWIMESSAILILTNLLFEIIKPQMIQDMLGLCHCSWIPLIFQHTFKGQLDCLTVFLLKL